MSVNSTSAIMKIEVATPTARPKMNDGIDTLIARVLPRSTLSENRLL